MGKMSWGIIISTMIFKQMEQNGTERDWTGLNGTERDWTGWDGTKRDKYRLGFF